MGQARTFRISSLPIGVSILFALALGALAGCETTPRTTARLDQALSHYESQQYHLAHQQAVEAYRSPGATPAQRERAAYLAGLAAFRSGDTDEAEIRLSAAIETSDPQLRASAQAILGQIRLEQNRPSQAARLFETASQGLTGEDAQQARRYAAIAHYESGDLSAAQRWYEPASHDTQHFRGGFTLQVGAFQERSRAQQAAAEARAAASAQGLGPVNVRESTDSRGRRLYLVQFGQFPTRQSAAQARSHLGRLEYIVAPLPQG